MPGKFHIQTAKNGKTYFNLHASNGEVILTSQMYVSPATAAKGVKAVQSNAADAGQFKTCVNEGGKHYFVLRARNHQVIGASQAYASEAAMKKGIRAVKSAAPKAKVEQHLKSS